MKPSQHSLEKAAQAWCTPETSNIVMNEKLAFVFAQILDAELASTPKVDGWISVDERLPEVDPLGIIRVLVSDGYNIDTAMYRYKEFSIGNSSKLINKIIWWQYITPIPDLPNTP